MASLTKSKDLYEGDSFRKTAIRESRKNGDPNTRGSRDIRSWWGVDLSIRERFMDLLDPLIVWWPKDCWKRE